VGGERFEQIVENKNKTETIKNKKSKKNKTKKDIIR